ncbi:MAG: hypothetical protein AMS27_15015 [Bacteroides sp. SM23_62_1]|nr:MAG: hypothetical protein AMS27_15015 [Bacteroides sp. SM23_62_1]
MRNLKIVLVHIILVTSIPCWAQISGGKTIGGSNPDYATFTDAINALTSGITGAVVFNVRSGTYSEQISIPQITGASPTNTITFKSESGDSSDVILTYSPGSSSDNYTLQLDGADHIVFSNMTLVSGGTEYSRVVLVKGITEDIEFSNNQLIGAETTSSSVDNAVFYSSSGLSTADIDYVFDRNLFQNGSFGIYHHGPSSNRETGTIIQNNTFNNQYSYGIFLFGQEAPIIEGNYLTVSSSNSTFKGIECRYCSENTRILKNKIVGTGTAGGTGISFTYSDGSSGNEAIVANNSVSLNTQGYSCTPIAASYASYLKVLYNSTAISGNYSFSSCLEIGYDLVNAELKNNIFFNAAYGYAVFSYVTSGLTSDYNDFYTNGTNLGYWSGNVADLNSWQTSSSQDDNSISVDPIYFSTSDLHAANILLKAGTPMASDITDDFEGDLRDGTTPCIGADEFTIPALSGTFTIGTTSSNYTSFTDALNDLLLDGVRGPVIFNVRSETFNEQITIPKIKNASIINTITFQSESGDSSLTTITFQPTSSGDNYTLKFNGAEHIRIKGITISTTGSEYATAVKIADGSSDIWLQNNQIIGVHPPTIVEGELIQGSTDAMGGDFIITNNLIKDGAYGIYISGQVSNHSKNFRIQDNYFLDQDRIGVYVSSFDTVTISDNLFSTNDEDYYYGIYCNDCDSDLTISRNSIITTSTTSGYGIYITNSNSTVSDYGVVSNNNIWLNSETSGSFASGLYMENSSYLKFVFNTNMVTGNLSFSKAIQLGIGISYIDLNNNIFANFAQGYAIHNQGNSGVTSDYNNLYTNGSVLGSWNSVNQSDLNAWRTASGQDANSLSIDPQFAAVDDPHFPNPSLNDAGTPIDEISDDIDGEMRDPTAPDIGADEFCLPPEADNVFGCTTRDIPDLTAAGDSIKWYSDEALTTMVHSGNSYPTGHTSAGTYTYYATQTINESESQADTVILTINITPVFPFASDTTICYGESTPDLTAAGTDLKWYDDETLTNQVNSGSTFATGETGPGTYTYYVTQTQDGCESDPDTSALTIHPIPWPPDGMWFISCFGDTVPDLVATGENVKWYSDLGLTNLVHIGDTFSSGDTLPGYYAYHPTQTVYGCESGPGVDTLWIKARPDEPLADSQSICIGENVPDLTATGTDLKWYEDAVRDISLQSGTTYATGKTGIGVYTYYVTQTVGGCESLNKTVALAINGLPVPDILEDQVLCEVDTQEFQLSTTTAAGHSYSWTSSKGDLTSSEANPIVKPTAPGSYAYFLTETIDSTGCLDKDTVTITINPDPMASVLADQILCQSEIRAFQIGASAIAGNSYSWISNPAGFVNAEANPSVTPTESITYILTETVDLTGCNKTDSVTFTINPNPDAIVLADQTICHSEIQEFSLGAVAVTGNSYSWVSNPTGFTSTQSNPKVTPEVTTEYTLTETINTTGCDNTNSVTITINPNPVVGITTGQNPIDHGYSTTLDASGASTYQWSPATGLSSTTGSQVTADPDTITTYILEGTNDFGCTGTDTITLYVYCPACGDETYFTATGKFNFGCTNNLYKNNLACSWTILPSGVDTIYLSFDIASFDIKQDDSIEVYNGQDATEQLIGKYNNNNLPPANIKGKNALHIRFVTDEDITGTGFQAKWSNTPIIVDEINSQLRPQFLIYPNPANDRLFIESDNVESRSIRVFIYNNLGQMILNRKIENFSGQIREEIDINNLESGIYHMLIVTEKDIIKCKFIKE